MDCKYNNIMLDNPIDCLDLMDTKFGSVFTRCHHLPMAGGHTSLAEQSHGFASSSFRSMNTTGLSIDGNHTALMEACQRLALPFEGHEEANAVDVKPMANERLLSMEWPDQCCADVGREGAIGYSNGGLGSWAGMMNGPGSARPSELEFS
ncbi:hypothetical protein Cni_G06500 [Canna indica]|uniref:Uncharacterized protein n=1 Tax=Canna indica TaxID=4628 RepID=A0AAQ3Q6G0_9LILI|nr:hypothetical protein Cni_G06500 [Canna indica]